MTDLETRLKEERERRADLRDPYENWARKWGVDPYCDSGVGPGWVPLLEALAQKLSALGFDFSLVSQVKEKFGGLRFYIDAGAPEVYDLIDAAETESFRICETCGQPGERRSSSWIKTLCDAHAVERCPPSFSASWWLSLSR